MVKIGKPKGLIRYASYNSIKEGIQKIITPRVIGYSFVLLVLASVLGFTLANRSEVETTVLKVPGTLYQRTEDGFITNLYNVEFINKTFEEVEIETRVLSPSGAVLQRADGKKNIIPAEGMLKSVFFIRIPKEEVTGARTIVRIGIYKQGKLIDEVKAKFIGPVSKSSDVNSRFEVQRKESEENN